ILRVQAEVCVDCRDDAFIRQVLLKVLEYLQIPRDVFLQDSHGLTRATKRHKLFTFNSHFSFGFDFSWTAQCDAVQGEESRLLECLGASKGKSCVEFLYCYRRLISLNFKSHPADVVRKKDLPRIKHLCQLLRVTHQHLAITIDIRSDVGVRRIERLNFRRIRSLLIRSLIPQDTSAPLKVGRPFDLRAYRPAFARYQHRFMSQTREQ